ncbi:SMC5-SMC6 complex localization factor protein 2-like isoform X2 [Tubulanus polymorphus]|uniref:SMC5-SMC6 complex localization factor protein 2-like isoform X2 n=1 Tax=Tubulanus polymorphus TaxID=672921 RepID=UPI003DA58AF2
MDSSLTCSDSFLDTNPTLPDSRVESSVDSRVESSVDSRVESSVDSIDDKMKYDRGVFGCLEDSLQSLEIHDVEHTRLQSPTRPVTKDGTASPQTSPLKLLAGLNNLKKLFKDNRARVPNSPKPLATSELTTNTSSRPLLSDVRIDNKSRNIWDEFRLSTVEDVENKIAVSADSDQCSGAGGGGDRISSFADDLNLCDNDALLASDDSDDDLMEAPSILDNNSSRKLSLSEENLDSSSRSPDKSFDLDDSNSYTWSNSTSSKTTITLESLLENKRNQVKKENLYGPMEANLKSDLAKGGIRNMTFDEESNELPAGEEYLTALQKLQMNASTITTQHPGEVIFIPNNYQQVFDVKSLTLDSCGFTKSPTSSLDKCLAKLDYSMLAQYLDGDFILLCIHQLSTPNAFLNWLFQTVSIHEDYNVIRAGFHILYRVLMDDKCKDWAPPIKHIAEIFINYGASKESLGLEVEVLDNLGLTELRVQSDNQDIDSEEINDFGMENLISVIQIIAYSVQKRSHLYSSDELISLLLIICKVAIDETLTHDVLKYDFQVCLSMIIDAFKPETWSENFVVLVNKLSTLCEHHHNQVHIIRLMPHGKRGYKLQRSVAYCTLINRMLNIRNPSEGVDVKVSRLHALLANLKDQFDGDYYRLYSMVQIVDLSVGNETLPPHEKESLYILTDIMRALMSELRDNVHMIDCTKVKDLVVRIISKWTFMHQAMANVGKKRTLFDHFVTPSSTAAAAAATAAGNNTSSHAVITVSNKPTDPLNDNDDDIDDDDMMMMNEEPCDSQQNQSQSSQLPDVDVSAD